MLGSSLLPTSLSVIRLAIILGSSDKHRFLYSNSQVLTATFNVEGDEHPNDVYYFVHDSTCYYLGLLLATHVKLFYGQAE